ncbi:phosphoribosyl-ATP diphosphatase [bacterium]|nr:phosphoribosyl-ATP diphosphatase [Synechococcaceae bacterium WB6_1A_059]NDG31674.1 phosphoribosyl-ATP diphosphatase [bacterium]NDG79750.1 phosphoribosyl-ATP diphosphatase [Synechococcaceae bacterium WB8_1B_057]
MTTLFQDQAKFMIACGQTVGKINPRQFSLYKKLIAEEVDELYTAKSQLDELDALIDILVVTIGAIHSIGAEGEGAWQEVMRTNFSKINPDTGKVNKREDGKVLKPEGWAPPNLKTYLYKGE